MGREIPGDPEVTGFLVPRWCETPHFDPSTPWKEKAVARIAEKVSQASRKLAKPNDPKAVEIVMGDFNFDYPETGIYIPSLKKFMFAHLRDEDHPPRDLSSLEDVSIEQLIESRWTQQSIDRQAAMIQKYGIRRTIHWGG
jgi:hypothetical protein